MFCLTGDVHQDSMHSVHHRHIRVSEPGLAIQYAEIAAAHGVKVTLFVTGRSCVEHPHEIAKLAELDNVEIGGHTWNGLRPRALHRLFNVFWGSRYGPRFYQRSDIRRTLDAIEKATGKRPVCWRTHGYMSDHNTVALLQEMGIRVLSDSVQVGAVTPHASDCQLTSLPINIWTDHEHIFHAERTREHVAREVSNGNYNLASVSVVEWAELVQQQMLDVIRRGGKATLLVHPVCMKIADEFKSFTDLCGFLSRLESSWASECADCIPSEATKL